MSRALIFIGIVVVVLGLLWPWPARMNLGRLPGDIVIVRESFTFYVPITTGLLLSIMISLLVWLFGRGQ
jgi:hypothetical protein